MKQLDRFNLIDKIGRELQGRMTYSDIDLYLKGFKIDVSKHTSGANSKWVYVKELLADEQDETVLQIANELEIEHSYPFSADVSVVSSGYWAPNNFRLFLSHLASFKERTFQLKKALEPYGISAFVAHEAIEPTQEWQEEIEKALFSMDAMAAIIMPGFKDSNWTDQEVGIAIGRNVLVIPLRRGFDPYGFLGKVQGLQTANRTIAQVAKDIFHILINNPKSRGKMSEVLVGRIVTSQSEDDLKHLVGLLQSCEKIPNTQLQILQSKVPDNKEIAANAAILLVINKILEAYGMAKVTISKHEEFDDDIPF